MKKLMQWFAATVIIGSVITFPARAAESASVLLQKGIFAEETEGNLDAAIKIYEQIAAEAAANRAVVAQAQYRLAVCYQKKGSKEQAIKILNELVRQFPSDVSVSKKARATLVELGQAPSEEIRIRKIPLSVEASAFRSISPDERYIAYIPKVPTRDSSLDLAVHEMATGKTWIIDKGTDKRAAWIGVVFSPNGQWIAHDITHWDNSQSAIYVSKIDGSETRKLYERKAEQEEWLDIVGWSLDGTQVIVNSRSKADPYLVFTLDAKTGVKQEVARMSHGQNPDSMNLSSDRRYVARRQGSYPKRITLSDLKSGREETVVDRDAGDIFGWFSGDTKLLFSKNGIGGTNLWAIGIKDGKPSGEPELVWGKLGFVSPLGIAQDGNIYYQTKANNTDAASLWVMEGLLATKPSVPQTESWRIETDIPPDEMILGSNNSILDRKFGFGATLPKGWTIRSAVRREGGMGSLLVFTAPEIPPGLARISYRLTTPWKVPGPGFPLKQMGGPKPTTPAEVDSWLLKWERAFTQGHLDSPNPNYPGYKTRPESIVPRSINGHRALSWAANFTRNGTSWTELSTVIFGETAYAQVLLRVPTANHDAVGPALEQMVASVRFSPPQN